MRDRVISSAFIVIVVIVPTLVGGLIFAALLLVLGLAVFHEYLALVRKMGVGDAPGSGPLAAMAIILFAIAAYATFGIPAFYAVIAAATVAPMIPLLSASPSSSSLSFATLSSAGSLGLGLAIFAAIALRDSGGSVTSEWFEVLARTFAVGSSPTPRGLAWVLVVIFVTWMNDTGAYLIGKSFGRHPLAPNVSPRKTILGSVAGLAGAALIGAIGFAAFGLGAWWLGALAGGIIGIAGQIGDLAESYLKRAAGVKDSGNLIPGHGGLFDRVDGLLFAFPTGYVLAATLERLNP